MYSIILSLGCSFLLAALFKYAYKHAYVKSKSPPILVVFVGCIGAGKSTYMSNLESMFDKSSICFKQEPVAEWGEALVLFYENPRRYAFMFQMLALLSRRKILRDASEKTTARVLCVERCLLSDKHIFAQPLRAHGNLTQMEFEIYDKWHHECTVDSMPPQVHHIYLKATAQTCLERVRKRKRDGEEYVTEKYLEQCVDAHEDMARVHPPALVVDANGPVDVSLVYKFICDL